MKSRTVILTMNAWSLMIPELRPAIFVIASDDAVTAPIPELLAKLGYLRKTPHGRQPDLRDRLPNHGG